MLERRLDVDDPMWEVATARCSLTDVGVSGRKAIPLDPLLRRIRELRAQREIEREENLLRTMEVCCMLCGNHVALVDVTTHECVRTTETVYYRQRWLGFVLCADTQQSHGETTMTRDVI